MEDLLYLPFHHKFKYLARTIPRTMRLVNDHRILPQDTLYITFYCFPGPSEPRCTDRTIFLLTFWNPKD